MNMRHAILVMGLTGLLGGCASNSVTFITKTSLGVDVSSQPAVAQIGYDRFEGYIGPRFDNGAVPPVVASFATNGKLLDREVQQVYATGRAAEIATAAQGTALPPPSLNGPHQVMFFNTGTTLGLKLGFGANSATDAFTLGYKRREISVIPITEGQFPSVLATIQNDVEAASRDKAGLNVTQYFATGLAADAMAGQATVRSLLSRRFEALDQSRSALSILSCVSSLPDGDLPRVWKNVGVLELFKKDDPNLVATLGTKPPAEARALYASYVARDDETDAARSELLRRHREFVCAFAGR